MAFVKKDTKAQSEDARVRVTITSRNPKAAESVTTNYVNRAREEKVAVRGPVRLPTRTLKITTRKTPCGNGTNTWDTFELKIYKRVIELKATPEIARKIASFSVDPGVDVSITLPDSV